MAKKKILVIREYPLKHFILCMPAFAAIRKFHKDDEITILTDKSLIKLCKASGYFDRGWIDTRPQWFEFIRLYKLIKRIRDTKFDMVYDLQNDDRSASYFKLMGFKKPNWNSSRVEWCSHYSEHDEQLNYQQMIAKQLAVAGILSVPKVDISHMGSDITKNFPGNYAIICSGGNRENLAHKWNPMKYAEVIDHLYTEHGLPSVILGDQINDIDINKIVADQCVNSQPINMTGQTSISDVIALGAKAKLCLGNDTGATFVSAMAGARTVMICSRFSPPDLIAPLIKNIAFIEEPLLENLETPRVIEGIEQFCFVEANEVQKTIRTLDIQETPSAGDKPV